MTDFLFEPFIASLAIKCISKRFPVRRIFCVGRNYAAHVKEMGGDGRDPPFFFMKPLTALLSVESEGAVDLPYPPGTENYHHEVELVAALHSGGRNLTPEQALACVYGYAIGLDMTRRDLQRQFADKKQPWMMGKAADYSAPIGPLHRVDETGHFDGGAIQLQVNSELRQNSDLADMIWPVGELLAHLSKFFMLQPGDLVFTGTPEGVGPVVIGQKIVAEIEKLGRISCTVIS